MCAVADTELSGVCIRSRTSVVTGGVASVRVYQAEAELAFVTDVEREVLTRLVDRLGRLVAVVVTVRASAEDVVTDGVYAVCAYDRASDSDTACVSDERAVVSDNYRTRTRLQ